MLLDLPLLRREQTEAIATLARLHLDVVTALALTLEGPVLCTQEFVSAVTEHLLEYASSCGRMRHKSCIEGKKSFQISESFCIAAL